MSEMKGTRLFGPAVPLDAEDQYPTHYARYGHGGLRTVASLEERDAIAFERQEAGMLVYVQDQDRYFKLVIPSGILGAANWIEFNSGTGSDHRHDDLYQPKGDYADAFHQHAMGDVLGLGNALSGKAPVNHEHQLSSILGLEERIDNLANKVHQHDNRYYTETEMDSFLAGKADVQHPHDLDDIEGLQGALDGKANMQHEHDVSDISGLQSTLDGLATSSSVEDALSQHHAADSDDHDDRYYTEQEVDILLGGKSDVSHGHAISDVAGLQTELDGKSEVGHQHDDRYYTSQEVDTALTGKSDVSHGHAISDVAGLQDALDAKSGSSHTHDDRYYTEQEVDILLGGKSDVSHGHGISDVAGLQTELDGKSEVGHQHDTATTEQDGFMSAADKEKLDGLEAGAINQDTADTRYEQKANKGQVNGYASLGPDGKIPSSQIPAIALSSVQTVVDATARKSLQNVQEGDVVKESSTGATYILGPGDPSLDDSWISVASDSNVIEVNGKPGPSVSLTTTDIPEGANQYFTDVRARAALTKARIEELLTGAISSHHHGSATTSKAGFMSAEDKAKLDGIESGATAYTHPDSGVPAGTYRSVTVNQQGHVTAGSNPTTLSGYGITDAAPSSHVGARGNVHGTVTTSEAGFMSAADKVKLDSIAEGANAYAHPASGVAAGTYRSVTVDAQGHVTAGTTPTTLAGYGITDAAPSSHVGATGSAHGAATPSVAGFMSADDKAKLDGIGAGANNYQHPTGDGYKHVPATGTTSNGKFLKAGATAGSISWSTIAISDISELQDSLDNHTHDDRYYTESEINNLLALKADGTHNHAISDITGLQSALDSKSDAHSHPYLPLAGGTMTGLLTLSGGPTTNLHAATKKYVDDSVAGKASSSHTHTAATTSSSGFMSASDKVKLDGIEPGANYYVHPTGASYKHLPVIGASFGGRYLRAGDSGDASWSKIQISEVEDLEVILETKAPDSHTHDYLPIGGGTVTGKLHLLDAITFETQAVTKSYVDTVAYDKADSDHGHNNATQSSAGFMSIADKTKLDGIESGANKYVHPTTDGNKHVPATGTTNSGKFLKAGATAGSLSWSSISVSDVTGLETILESKSDSHSHPYLPLAGGTMSGPVILSGAPSNDLHPATKKYVDTALSGKASSSHTHSISNITGLQTDLNSRATVTYVNEAFIPKTGGDVSGELYLHANPTDPTSLVPKSYVDVRSTDRIVTAWFTASAVQTNFVLESGAKRIIAVFADRLIARPASGAYASRYTYDPVTHTVKFGAAVGEGVDVCVIYEELIF